MKQLLLFMIMTGVAPAAAQDAAVDIDKMHVAYVTVDNPITISLENVPCNKLSLAVDIGTLQKGLGDCQYTFTTDKPGRAVFTISKKEGAKYIEAGKVTYLVKPLPRPTAMIAGKHGGTIAVAIFKAQEGMIARLNGFDFDTSFKIASFQMEVVRDGKVLLSTKNNGNVFEPVARTILTHVAPGDMVAFSNIMCFMPDKRQIELESFSIDIIQ